MTIDREEECKAATLGQHVKEALNSRIIPNEKLMEILSLTRSNVLFIVVPNIRMGLDMSFIQNMRYQLVENVFFSVAVNASEIFTKWGSTSVLVERKHLRQSP